MRTEDHTSTWVIILPAESTSQLGRGRPMRWPVSHGCAADGSTPCVILCGIKASQGPRDSNLSGDGQRGRWTSVQWSFRWWCSKCADCAPPARMTFTGFPHSGQRKSGDLGEAERISTPSSPVTSRPSYIAVFIVGFLGFSACAQAVHGTLAAILARIFHQ